LEILLDVKRDRPDEDKDSISYYATVMENIVSRGWGFVEHEEDRLTAGIARAFEDMSEENEEIQRGKATALRRYLNILKAYMPVPAKRARPGQTMLPTRAVISIDVEDEEEQGESECGEKPQA